MGKNRLSSNNCVTWILKENKSLVIIQTGLTINVISDYINHITKANILKIEFFFLSKCWRYLILTIFINIFLVFEFFDRKISERIFETKLETQWGPCR